MTPDSGRPGWAEARSRSFAAATALASQSVALADAVGRTLATEVRALSDLPHYSSSAMDGWAVAGDGPWRVVAERELTPGTATPIITGGVIPRGTRGVLRSENAIVTSDSLESCDPAEPHEGQHIRPAGEEARAGDPLVHAGVRVNPAHVALAAICGHDRLDVITLPRVGFLFTGDEVVESGMPLPGQVRDSFGPQLPAFVSALGASVGSRQRVGDDLAATVAAIERADCDVLITTGGTGSSSADHLRDAVHALGADLLVDGVAMRPGGPTLLARLRDPRRTDRFVVCLPGNPLAAMMGVLTVAEPLIAALGGRPRPATTSVVIGEEVAGRNGSTLLIPYRLVEGLAVPNRWSSAGMMRGLADADAVLVVPEHGVPAGGSAESLGLPWNR